MLEPCDAKVSSMVLRGLGDRKVAWLLGSLPARPGHSRDTPVTETTGRIVAYAWKCDGPALSVRQIRA
jgi:hypothetical protein